MLFHSFDKIGNMLTGRKFSLSKQLFFLCNGATTAFFASSGNCDFLIIKCIILVIGFITVVWANLRILVEIPSHPVECYRCSRQANNDHARGVRKLMQVLAQRVDRMTTNGDIAKYLSHNFTDLSIVHAIRKPHTKCLGKELRMCLKLVPI